MQLKTDLQVKHLSLTAGKGKEKHSVGNGLYLIITTTGKYWRYSYTYNGKRKDAALGVYNPSKDNHTSLKDARVNLAKVKAMLADGIDPNQIKAERKADAAIRAEAQAKEESETANTFKVVALKWFEQHQHTIVEDYSSKIKGRLERWIFPRLGDTPITKLTRKQIVDAVTLIADAGSTDTANRCTQYIRAVLEFACDRGWLEAVPVPAKLTLAAVKSKPMPAVTEPQRIGELLRAIDGYSGTFVVRTALKLLPYLFARAGEFRTAEWGEIDFDNAIWTIPACHRKLRKAQKEDSTNTHTIPLSQQAVSLLEELHQFTGSGKYVLPSVRGDARPMSENTINTALAAMGFKGEMVGHGWRSVFSSTMNGMGFNPDAIEKQLAHTEKNKVRAAYNRQEYLEERTRIMQHWADYLDGLRDGATVIPINRKRA